MTNTHVDYQLSQLDQLEAESIHIFREVASEFEKPVLMFSGGKDSIVMLRLAEKAFFPAKIPFPVLQVDTGFDFPEVLSCCDSWVNRLGVRLVVASVDDAIKNGVIVDDGKTSRNRMQIGTLLHAIEEQPRRPADAIAAEFFRNRRYIGGSDRRAIADLACRALGDTDLPPDITAVVTDAVNARLHRERTVR